MLLGRFPAVMACLGLMLSGCVGRPMNYGAQTYAPPQYVTAPNGPVASPMLSPTPVSNPQFQMAPGPVATPTVITPQASNSVIVTPTVTASSWYVPGGPAWQTAMVPPQTTFVSPAPRYVDMRYTNDGRPSRWNRMGHRYGAYGPW